jgi:hypothetical protein
VKQQGLFLEFCRILRGEIRSTLGVGSVSDHLCEVSKVAVLVYPTVTLFTIGMGGVQQVRRFTVAIPRFEPWSRAATAALVGSRNLKLNPRNKPTPSGEPALYGED